jgi:hypothetical protein
MMRKANKLVSITNGIVLKPYSIGELAKLYDVDRKTFRSWLKPIMKELGKRQGRYYNIKQMKIIFKQLDFPASLAA